MIAATARVAGEFDQKQLVPQSWSALKREVSLARYDDVEIIPAKLEIGKYVFKLVDLYTLQHVQRLKYEYERGQTAIYVYFEYEKSGKDDTQFHGLTVQIDAPGIDFIDAYDPQPGLGVRVDLKKVNALINETIRRGKKEMRNQATARIAPEDPVIEKLDQLPKQLVINDQRITRSNVFDDYSTFTFVTYEFKLDNSEMSLNVFNSGAKQTITLRKVIKDYNDKSKSSLFARFVNNQKLFPLTHSEFIKLLNDAFKRESLRINVHLPYESKTATARVAGETHGLIDANRIRHLAEEDDFDTAEALQLVNIDKLRFKEIDTDYSRSSLKWISLYMKQGGFKYRLTLNYKQGAFTGYELSAEPAFAHSLMVEKKFKSAPQIKPSSIQARSKKRLCSSSRPSWQR